MRCSRKFPIFLTCVALAAGAIAAEKKDKPKEDPKKESAKKKSKDGEKKPAATPAPTEEGQPKTPPKFSLPLPKGQDSIGVTIPYNDNTGRKTMNFRIGVASRTDDDHVKMKKLLIETFNDETGAKEITIEMPTSALDLNTRIITGHDGVTIKRSDFEITGKSMEFNTETKQGRLAGDVRMVIHNLTDELGSKPGVKANE